MILLPVMLPLAAIASIFGRGKGVDRTPEEVAQRIEKFIDGTGGGWDWDDLISVRITDPKLDALVSEADRSGPPFDENRLREIVGRIRALGSD